MLDPLEDTQAFAKTFVTVTGLPNDVTVFPAASTAVAVRSCDPSAVPVESQSTENGADVSVPIVCEPALNVTDAHPTLSEHDAVTVCVPVTADDFAGPVIFGTGAA